LTVVVEMPTPPATPTSSSSFSNQSTISPSILYPLDDYLKARSDVRCSCRTSSCPVSALPSYPDYSTSIQAPFPLVVPSPKRDHSTSYKHPIAKKALTVPSPVLCECLEIYSFVSKPNTIQFDRSHFGGRHVGLL
jgi:hypothetical protein